MTTYEARLTHFAAYVGALHEAGANLQAKKAIRLSKRAGPETRGATRRLRDVLPNRLRTSIVGFPRGKPSEARLSETLVRGANEASFRLCQRPPTTANARRASSYAPSLRGCSSAYTR